MKATLIRPQDRLLLSRAETAEYLGISVSLLLSEVDKGNLPKPRNIGSRTLWVRPELDRAFGVESGASVPLPPPPGDEWDLA